MPHPPPAAKAAEPIIIANLKALRSTGDGWDNTQTCCKSYKSDEKAEVNMSTKTSLNVRVRGAAIVAAGAPGSCSWSSS